MRGIEQLGLGFSRNLKMTANQGAVKEEEEEEEKRTGMYFN